MMEHSTVLYEKNFSQLENLQKQKKVTYSLVQEWLNGTALYGIKIIEEDSKGVTTDLVAAVSKKRERVQDLITFLYENSVMAGCCRDILDDLLIQ